VRYREIPCRAGDVACDLAQVNSIDCNRFSEHMLATGSGCKGRGVVRVWDDRKMDAPLHELTLHSDVVDVRMPACSLVFTPRYFPLLPSARCCSSCRLPSTPRYSPLIPSASFCPFAVLPATPFHSPLLPSDTTCTHARAGGVMVHPHRACPCLGQSRSQSSTRGHSESSALFSRCCRRWGEMHGLPACIVCTRAYGHNESERVTGPRESARAFASVSVGGKGLRDDGKRYLFDAGSRREGGHVRACWAPAQRIRYRLESRLPLAHFLCL